MKTDTTPTPQKEDKDYEQEISKDGNHKKYFKIPVEGGIGSNEIAWEAGARWFRDKFHLPAMKEKEEEIERLERQRSDDELETSLISTEEKLAELTEQDAKQSAEIEKLREENKKYKFMIDNGLGFEDMKNDIEYPKG